MVRTSLIAEKTDRCFWRLFPCLLFFLSAVSSPVSGQSDSLSSRLDALLQRRVPPGSHVSMLLYDLTAGETLYDCQSDKLCRPASVMKLLTGITALSLPQADEPFRTEVWAQGVVEADTLHGDLYVVGGFDPEFDDNALDSLVAVVARQPFSVVSGCIYGDVSLKDSLYWGNGWAWDDNPAAFQPYLSPLMLDKGVLTVTASPAGAGEKAQLACTPVSGYYEVVNETQSRCPQAGRFRVSRNWLEGGNRVCVSGNVDGERTATVNLCGSQQLFMHTFVERLRQAGISCPADYSFREWQGDSLSSRLAVYETGMQPVLNQMMKESDNLNAEALLCRIGSQATGRRHLSATEGLDPIRKLLERLGHPAGSYRLADGCGLSNYNHVSAGLVVSMLRYAYSRTELFQKLYKSLPVAGVDGTLKNRMKRTPAYKNVHAKTGSFTGINCLAGYMRAANGHWVAFAILNQNVLTARLARDFQDAVCSEVCSGW